MAARTKLKMRLVF